MNHELTLQQAESYEASESGGFGKSKAADGTHFIRVWIKVRRDSQIPEFDCVTEFKWVADNSEDHRKYNEKIADLVNENGGMFVEDALKLNEKDIFSLLGEYLHPKDIFPIPSLHALKKAIVNYFEKTKQEERLRRSTQTVICNCRHVTDMDIAEVTSRGKKTFEEVSMATGAGTGCGSCINKLKTALGKLT